MAQRLDRLWRDGPSTTGRQRIKLNDWIRRVVTFFKQPDSDVMFADWSRGAADGIDIFDGAICRSRIAANSFRAACRL